VSLGNDVERAVVDLEAGPGAGPGAEIEDAEALHTADVEAHPEREGGEAPHMTESEATPETENAAGQKTAETPASSERTGQDPGRSYFNLVDFVVIVFSFSQTRTTNRFPHFLDQFNRFFWGYFYKGQRSFSNSTFRRFQKKKDDFETQGLAIELNIWTQIVLSEQVSRVGYSSSCVSVRCSTSLLTDRVPAFIFSVPSSLAVQHSRHRNFNCLHFIFTHPSHTLLAR